MGKINIRKHIGDILVKKGVISKEQFDEAFRILHNEPSDSSRRLGQILFQDIGLNRHLIMREISKVYAFREVLSDIEIVPDYFIETIKKIVASLPKEIIEDLVTQKAIPYQLANGGLTIAAADPSDPKLQLIINKLNYKQTELVYCNYELVEQILEKVYERKNEFLDLLEEIEYEEAIIEPEEENVDEDEIDAEIKSKVCLIHWLKVC